jgi:CRP-like cAMP-binding protein
MHDSDKQADERDASRLHPGTTNPLILKLDSLAKLSDADRDVLEHISANPQTVEAGTDLIRVGDKPDGVYLILDGIACRYTMRANGTRQIMAYLIPGDYCDLDVALLARMDHSIGTLSACKVVRIDLDAIQDLLRHHPDITHALRLATLVDEATLREWVVNLGRRNAEERIAHLLCELLLRLRAVSRAAGNGYALPVTQVDLADTTGQTAVQVNRVLASLQQQGLIALSAQQLKVLDLARLEALAEFKPDYLHLGGRAAA